MTIKSKTFYVSDMADIEIRRGTYATLFYTSTKDDTYKNEITISWKEDRKAEVTESQVDEIIKEWRDPKSYGYSLDSFVKDRMFKDVK